MIIATVWEEFLKIVKEEVGSRVVETWFKSVVFSQWDSSTKTVYLQVPNSFIKDWIESNYTQLLKVHLGRLLHETTLTILFTQLTTTTQLTAPSDNKPLSTVVESGNYTKRAHTLPVKKDEIVSQQLTVNKVAINKNYQFDTFVVGPNNSLAYAAAKAVADKPGILYNPLFIYGNSGLGKTHLLHAVGNAIVAANPKCRILYQSADRFVSEFINAIRFDKVPQFETRYKDVDVLLIDDIQFISNKEQTQEAFFHIFNTLYEARKQIVFSSDSLPGDIEGLAGRLRTRLDGGLITDVHVPTLETKIAIVKKKAEAHGTILADDVAHFIAARVLSSVRELEGLLIRVFAFADLTNQPVTLELAEKVLTRSSKEKAKQPVIDLQHIAAKVARHYNYSLGELRSNKRHKDLALARHIAMYLMKKLTDKSLADIALFWKRKDHSTVIHAFDKIEQYKRIDKKLNSAIENLEQAIANY
ncbi:chromosomal replication initiator protein DnaA [Candidatus Dependentiae bacterium]|nr:chromosomal replication initiator protein DnaA [Candidatus Dependentiae bacterium]